MTAAVLLTPMNEMINQASMNMFKETCPGGVIPFIAKSGFRGFVRVYPEHKGRVIFSGKVVFNPDHIVIGVIFSFQNNYLRKMFFPLEIKIKSFRHSNKVAHLNLNAAFIEQRFFVHSKRIAVSKEATPECLIAEATGYVDMDGE